MSDTKRLEKMVNELGDLRREADAIYARYKDRPNPGTTFWLDRLCRDLTVTRGCVVTTLIVLANETGKTGA